MGYLKRTNTDIGSNMDWKNNTFDGLAGKVLVKIEGMEKASEEIIFTCSDGSEYSMFHEHDCCERVDIEDVCGDVKDLIGEPILLAEIVESNSNPEGVPIPEYQDDSFTWSFVKLSTIKGGVTIRWYGESNGYYCETPSFVKVK